MSEKVPAKKKKKAPEEPKIKAKTKASSDSVVGLESKEPPSEKPKKKEKKVKPRSTSITGTTATREEAPKKKGSAKKARSSSVTGGGVQKATKAVAPKSITMQLGEFHDHQFELKNEDETNTIVRISFGVESKGKVNPYPNIVGMTVEKVRDAIVSCISYAWQSYNCKALLRTVIQQHSLKQKPILLKMSVKSFFFPDEEAIYWDPFSLTWMMDYGVTTPKRNKQLCYLIPDLVGRRPSNHPEAALKGSPTDLVVGVQSPGAILVHELGHFVQYFMRPHYFTREFKAEALKIDAHKSVLMKLEGEPFGVHLIPDVTIPWEADNVSWNEIPFCESMREIGIIECLRWHYGDALKVQSVDDTGIFVEKGVTLMKYKIDDSWYHSNELWGIKLKGKTKTPKVQFKSGIVLKKHAKEQKAINLEYGEAGIGPIVIPDFVQAKVITDLDFFEFLE